MKGNVGKHRLIERDYFRVLADAITLDVWRQIVERQISDAIGGNAKARDWIARFLLGERPMTLTGLAEKEVLAIEPLDEILASAEGALQPNVPDKLVQMYGGGSLEPTESYAHRVLRLKHERQLRTQAGDSSNPTNSGTSDPTGRIGKAPSAQ